MLKRTAPGGAVTVGSKCAASGVEICIDGTNPEAEHGPASFFGSGQEPHDTQEDNDIELGLTWAKHIVDSHGGKLWNENNSRQGSSWSFVLPC
jgi:two-component system phosphate regulon sensor histidine kinase PhoR